MIGILWLVTAPNMKFDVRPGGSGANLNAFPPLHKSIERQIARKPPFW